MGGFGTLGNPRHPMGGEPLGTQIGPGTNGSGPPEGTEGSHGREPITELMAICRRNKVQNSWESQSEQ